MLFTLINETKEEVPHCEFEAIMHEILGEKYNLNLIITTSDKIKKLNTIYRNKEYSTDILSFPLSKSEGEMYISLSDTKTEAKKFDRPFENFFVFLFIHGCTHLKGYDHGAIMERMEAKIRTTFGI